MALKFVGGFEVDTNGNSRGVRLTDGEIAVRMAQEQQRISAVSASADIISKVEASIAAGKPVTVADFDRAFVDVPHDDRMVRKTDLKRRGLLAVG